ncbi:aminoacrylate peracid reductase [Nitrobacteraceae bacterium AZCC 1564]
MPIEIIIPPGSPPPLAPYSPGTKAGGFIYVSGTLAIGPKGETVGVGDATAQTRFVLESIKSVVEAGGGSMKNVVFNQIFLKDLADYAAMNAVYKEYFPENPPARYCIQAPLVRPEFLVEIATTAYVGA